MSININLKFIKIWTCRINTQSKSKIRQSKIIPANIRILLTSNGSFTRNSSILYNQLTDILLVQEYQRIYKTNTIIQHYNIVQNSKRQVWLIHYCNKKKLFLPNQISINIL
uniref:Uncharacterized protein n=1 Tax=Helminthora furcellata TaxID=1884666 RepID=A0A1G4NZ40_9FLOR|nr:Hypothetical protein ORF_7 [Helminthora furcellata]SCW21090.1 Hypothetical protein ORF_7 [Helminthora furcellata]SCW23950.1 Hypothetical protein ORF_7 [Helminthora furcellata]